MSVVESGTHEAHVPETGKEGWHKITDCYGFIKWQYRDTPYRVVALLSDRGHWKVLFTSWYSPTSYLVAGNLGGENAGRFRAVAAASEFMDENKYGCPPPGEYE